MSPVGKPKPYVENKNHVPDPIAMHGTFDTSGTGGGAQYDYDAVVDVFKDAAKQEVKSKASDKANLPDAGEVPSAGSGDQTVLTGTLDTTGTGGNEGLATAPKVEAPEGEITSVGGDKDTIGAGTDDAQTQGTVDTSGTDEPTSPSVEASGAEPVEPIVVGEKTEGEDDGKKAEDEPFSPVGRTVDAVNKYLETADDEERQRVLLIEAEGKNRTGIVEGPYGV